MDPVDRVRAALIDKGLGNVVLELDDTAATAPLAAAAIGAHYGIVVPVGAIVKSLVFLIDEQPAIVLGSGDRNVDQKRLGELYGVSRKKVKLADAATAYALTGFEVGGVAPIGHTQQLPVVIDEALGRFDTVWAAAGAQHADFPDPIPAVGRNHLGPRGGDAAVKGAHSVNYEGAGTIEFLLDKHKNFYFMEMNTSIQVEHPVTELVYDVDLVRQQILVAAGEKIEARPKKPHGHAIEFRINAEDPENNFRPSPGKITSLHFPGGFGVRNDSHIYHSYSIPPYYDSLIAKLIVWGTDRERAIMRGKRALNEFIVEGIKTTIPFHLKVLEDSRFKSGKFDTSFLEKF